MLNEHKGVVPTIRINKKREQYDEVKLNFEESTLERE
jgi:hypothetical protein